MEMSETRLPDTEMTQVLHKLHHYTTPNQGMPVNDESGKWNGQRYPTTQSKTVHGTRSEVT
jgi:hypothetical protein